MSLLDPFLTKALNTRHAAVTTTAQNVTVDPGQQYIISNDGPDIIFFEVSNTASPVTAIKPNVGTKGSQPVLAGTAAVFSTAPAGDSATNTVNVSILASTTTANAYITPGRGE